MSQLPRTHSEASKRPPTQIPNQQEMPPFEQHQRNNPWALVQNMATNSLKEKPRTIFLPCFLSRAIHETCTPTHQHSPRLPSHRTRAQLQTSPLYLTAWHQQRPSHPRPHPGEFSLVDHEPRPDWQRQTMSPNPQHSSHHPTILLRWHARDSDPAAAVVPLLGPKAITKQGKGALPGQSSPAIKQPPHWRSSESKALRQV
jgi:hypothetical protein